MCICLLCERLANFSLSCPLSKWFLALHLWQTLPISEQEASSCHCLPRLPHVRVVTVGFVSLCRQQGFFLLNLFTACTACAGLSFISLSCCCSVLMMSLDILGTNYDQCRSMVKCCFTSTETVKLIRRKAQDGHLARLSHSSWTLISLSWWGAILIPPW